MTKEKVSAALADLAKAREPPPGKMLLAYRAMEAERSRAHRLHRTAGRLVALWAARRIRAGVRRTGLRPDVELRGSGWISRYGGSAERHCAAHISLCIRLPHADVERATIEVSIIPRSADHLEEWCRQIAARIVAWERTSKGDTDA